jgi:hypothetical protein
VKFTHCGRFLQLIAGCMPWLLVPLYAGLAAPAAADPPPAPQDQPNHNGEMPLSQRLSPSQYRHTIDDIFGRSIRITGRFEPETRVQGLLAIGDRTANVSDTGVQRYDELARGVASQVVDPQHRASLIGCTPRSPARSDDACARSFFSRVGPLLYRRPLTADEIDARVRTAGYAADKLHDFYTGLSMSLAEMLTSPQFLFRYKMMEPDPAHRGQMRLDAYSKATELSYFLWDTTPDQELLHAAASGALQTPAGLKRQVDRLLASPRMEDGIRAFFSDMLGFSDFDTVTKDSKFFPRYTLKVKDESQEQTLRTIVDHVLNRQGDYRDLFTTPHTFLTRDLAALYEVPLVDDTDNGQPQRWIAYTYPPADPRAGILSEASFTALYSPAGRTSPTGRGKALRENILCERVPPPPGNVSFKFIEDTSNPEFKTARERLTAHRSAPMCAGCHRLTDPIGLSLENFDSGGGFRSSENGVPIDASGELSGIKFYGPLGLGKTIHDDPSTTSCVARKAFAFDTGYMPPVGDAQWKQILQQFAASHYNFLDLMRQIALSDLAYSVPTSQALTAANR